MAHMQNVHEAVYPDRGTDPTELYKNLALEISSQSCAGMREKLIREFIRSNPNLGNMRRLAKQIGCFSHTTLYKWWNDIHNPAQGQPMAPAHAQGMARNISRQANPSCLLRHARQQPQPHELAIDGPRYVGAEYPIIIGQTGQHPRPYPTFGAAWSYTTAS